MAQTDKHALPYPEPTAEARMGASDIQALAEAVDARLGGALVIASVADEPVANDTTDRLNLTVDDAGSSGVFENIGPNSIRYTGIPTVVATVYVAVTWAGNAAGSRRAILLQNGSVLVTDRITPDAEQVTNLFSWPTELSTDDELALDVKQTSGGSLDVAIARFRCVVHGIQSV